MQAGPRETGRLEFLFRFSPQTQSGRGVTTCDGFISLSRPRTLGSIAIVLPWYLSSPLSKICNFVQKHSAGQALVILSYSGNQGQEEGKPPLGFHCGKQIPKIGRVCKWWAVRILQICTYICSFPNHGIKTVGDVWGGDGDVFVSVLFKPQHINHSLHSVFLSLVSLSKVCSLLILKICSLSIKRTTFLVSQLIICC